MNPNNLVSICVTFFDKGGKTPERISENMLEMPTKSLLVTVVEAQQLLNQDEQDGPETDVTVMVRRPPSCNKDCVSNVVSDVTRFATAQTVQQSVPGCTCDSTAGTTGKVVVQNRGRRVECLECYRGACEPLCP